MFLYFVSYWFDTGIRTAGFDNTTMKLDCEIPTIEVIRQVENDLKKTTQYDKVVVISIVRIAE